MADMFLKLAGVSGESTDKTHGGEVELHSFTWGLSNTADVTSAKTGAGAAGRAHFQDFSCTKQIDSSSTTLMQFVADGHHFSTALLTVRKPGGTQIEFYTMEFDEVYITNYTLGGGGSGDPVEMISFAYATVKSHYKMQNADGSIGSGGDYAWDLKSNVEIAA